MIATLIIDNNAISRESLKQLLAARYPYVKALEVPNGKDALQILREKVPDVVLMNMRLPDLNGLHVLRHIRNQSSRIVIVALGDDDTPEYREAAFDNGADYFIPMCSFSAEETNSLLDAVFFLQQ